MMTVRTNKNSAIREPRVDRRCKPTHCFELDKTWASAEMAGAALGISPQSIRNACNKSAHMCNGWHFCYEEDVATYRKLTHTVISTSNSEKESLKAELERYKTMLEGEMHKRSENDRDAALWRAHQAEQEKKRKLAESLQQAIAEAKNTVEQRKRIADKAADDHKKAVGRVTEAEEELAKLESMTLEDWDGDEANKFKHRMYQRNWQKENRAKKSGN